MKKVWNILQTVLTWVLVILTVAMMVFTVVSVNTFDRNDRDVFGYKAYIILSDSMSTVEGDASLGYFNAGDLVLVQEVDPASIQAGDIVSYISTNPENYGATVTHMVRRLTEDASGMPGFVTYGTSTGADDANIVTYPYILGKYRFAVPKVGSFFLFMKTTPGYIVCILLPFLLLIGMQGFQSIRLFRKYKQEQLAALEAARAEEQKLLQAEREALAEERRRQEEMMQKLLEMQAAMQKNEAPPHETAQAPAQEPTASDTPTE